MNNQAQKSQRSYKPKPWGKKPYSKSYGLTKYQKQCKQAYRDKQRGIVHIPKGIVPNKLYIKLKQLCMFNSGSVAASQNLAVAIVNWLSLNSPSGLMSGQPPGYDQWGGLFQRYTVLASKIVARISRFDSGTNPCQVGLLPSTMTTTQIRTAMDNGGTINTGVRMGPFADWHCKQGLLPNANSGVPLVLTSYCKTADMYPDKEVLDDESFTGTTASFTSGSTNPTNSINTFLLIQNASGAAATTVSGSIEVTYYCMFSSPVVVYDA